MPMTLKLVKLHWGSGPIIVCINDKPRLTLTLFTAMSNLVTYAFIWGKLLEIVIKWKKLTAYDKSDIIFIFV